MLSILLNSLWLLFGLAITSNILALALLPRTQGFTSAGMTATCLLLFSVNLWALSRILYKGMDLSLLVPIMTAVIPLATIGIGVIAYAENASLTKLGLLVVACGLIAIAAKVS